MKSLTIDLETYSSVDLTKCGVYSYTQAKDFEILLFGYAFDEEEVRVVDFKNGEEQPKEVKAALGDSNVIKTAFNANFERTCLGAYFKVYMPPEQWRCTSVQALELGLPSSLEQVSRCLKLKVQKMTEGKALIDYFSMPCKATKTNGFRERNLPEHNLEKWDLFKSYCKNDVEVERTIRQQLLKYETAGSEQRLWCLDQRINDRGIRVHRELVKQAVAYDLKHQKSIKEEVEALAGDLNLNSPEQLKQWLLKEEGLKVQSLSKEVVELLIKKASKKKVKKILKLRQELSKTSVRKYEAMERAMCTDHRIRGLFQFYGASRTGRWAGRLVQVQNLPQNKLEDLETARDLLKEGMHDALEFLCNSVPEVLSQLTRTAFIPSENCRFIVADFSAIEARVIAHLAGERWRMEVFKSHGKIYEASAAKMFRVPMETIDKGSPLRQKGKVAELALGYQGSIGALKAMEALKLGLKEEELMPLVKAWRAANSNIEKFWGDVEKAAMASVRKKTVVSLQEGLEFSTEDGILFIRLPSGRRLAYAKAAVITSASGFKSKLTYEGLNQDTKQWVRLSTYGGKLVENIVQATARDCLAEAMLRLEEAGYKIVLHCHDEVVLEVPNGFGSLEEVQDIMATPISWAKGLPLRAEAFESGYYRK